LPQQRPKLDGKIPLFFAICAILSGMRLAPRIAFVLIATLIPARTIASTFDNPFSRFENDVPRKYLRVV